MEFGFYPQLGLWGHCFPLKMRCDFSQIVGFAGFDFFWFLLICFDLERIMARMALLRSSQWSRAHRFLGILWRREIDKIKEEKSNQWGFAVVEWLFQSIDGSDSWTLVKNGDRHRVRSQSPFFTILRRFRGTVLDVLSKRLDVWSSGTVVGL